MNMQRRTEAMQRHALISSNGHIQLSDLLRDSIRLAQAEHGRLTLGIDFCDTIADVKHPVIELARKEFGVAIDFNTLKTHKLEDASALTAEQSEYLRVKVWNYPERIRPVHPKVSEILYSHSRSVSYMLTTATDADDKTLEWWLKRNNIPIHEIVHVESSSSKFNTRTNVVGIFIDDYPPVAEIAANTRRPTILIQKPWNETFSAQGRGNGFVIPARDWPRIDMILREVVRVADLAT